MIIRRRILLDDVEREQYFKLYKFLFDDEFKDLSNDAKILYALLRDRHTLSIKNQWKNKDGEVYLIYSRNEMAEMLGLTNPPVLKAVKQLKEFKLMEEERQGINKPNLIYINE